MNALQKSLKNIIRQSDSDQGINIDLFGQDRYTNCREYYNTHVFNKTHLPNYDYKSILTIFKEFHPDEDFKSVLSKVGDGYYAIHRTLDGNKIVAFQRKISDTMALCRFHFKNNTLILASYNFVDINSQDSISLQKDILKQYSCKNINVNDFILTDIKNNKMLITDNKGLEVIFFNDKLLK